MRARTVVRQNDFAFGELSPEHIAAGDRDAVSRSLKRGRNVRILNSFGFCNRFGSSNIRKFAEGEHVLTRLVTSDGRRLLGAIRRSSLDIYATDGTSIATISGLPFASIAEVKQATVLSRVDQLYIARQGYPTQVFTRDPATDTWTLADYAFAVGPGQAPLQLYYRFAAKGITLQPSALTGSTDLVASAAVFDTSTPSKHIGVIFRYGVVDGAGKEILITAVTDSTHATGTVLNALPPTKTVTVGDPSGFVIGEEVKGLETEATGFITNISGDDISILMVRGFSGFDDENVDVNQDGTVDSGEYLVGEFTRSLIAKGTQTSATAAASVAWDEAVISPVRGYPGCVFERDGRLGFTNFPDPKLAGALALSVPDSTDNFDIGTGLAGDAIFVLLNEGGQSILQAVSAANLLLLTTDAAYYIPEGTDVPLSFQTFTAVKIGPVGIADGGFPAIVDEGVVYPARNANRIMALLSTGSLTSPWKLVDVSSKASHLISNPTRIAMTPGNADAPERYVMVLNGDGSVAVLFFDDAPARIGWVPWDTPNGLYTSMISIDGFLYTNCNRTLNSGTASFLERFDTAAQLDCSASFTVPGGVSVAFAGETLAVNQGTTYLGTFTVAGDGTISGLPDGSYQAGYHYNWVVQLWPPEPDGDDRLSFAYRHIGRASVQVVNSQSFSFGVTNTLLYTVPVRKTGDDTDAPPPLRSNWFRASFGGWQSSPNMIIDRPIPQPVQVAAVSQEVAF